MVIKNSHIAMKYMLHPSKYLMFTEGRVYYPMVFFSTKLISRDLMIARSEKERDEPYEDKTGRQGQESARVMEKGEH